MMDVNFSGTWTANLSKSRLLTAPPHAITAHIQHADPELEQELLITRLDGSEGRALFRCRTDCNQTGALLDGRPVRGGTRWDGDELIIETRLQFGQREMHLCDRWSLSGDGRTLTMEHLDGDLAGQRVVFERME